VFLLFLALFAFCPGYFDIRARDGRWVRIQTLAGDVIELPAGARPRRAAAAMAPAAADGAPPLPPPGSVFWLRYPGYPNWPVRVVAARWISLPPAAPGKVHIMFFNDSNQHAEVRPASLVAAYAAGDGAARSGLRKADVYWRQVVGACKEADYHLEAWRRREENGVICERSEEVAPRHERKRRSRACSRSLSHWTRSRTYCTSVERCNLAIFKLCGGLRTARPCQKDEVERAAWVS
jgi:hypothetical protein